MIKVEAICETGFANSTHKEILYFENDVTEDEIDEEVKDWAMNFISFGWKYTEEDDEFNS